MLVSRFHFDFIHTFYLKTTPEFFSKAVKKKVKKFFAPYLLAIHSWSSNRKKNTIQPRKCELFPCVNKISSDELKSYTNENIAQTVGYRSQKNTKLIDKTQIYQDNTQSVEKTVPYLLLGEDQTIEKTLPYNSQAARSNNLVVEEQVYNIQVNGELKKYVDRQGILVLKKEVVGVGIEQSNNNQDSLCNLSGSDHSYSFGESDFSAKIDYPQDVRTMIQQFFVLFPPLISKSHVESIAYKLLDHGMLRIYHTMRQLIKTYALNSATQMLFYRLIKESYENTQKTKIDINYCTIDQNSNYNYLIMGSCQYQHEKKPKKFVFASFDNHRYFELCTTKMLTEEFWSFFGSDDDTITIIITTNSQKILECFFEGFPQDKKKNVAEIIISNDDSEVVFCHEYFSFLSVYQNLNTLRLQNLNLEQVPTSIKDLSKLKKIYVTDNDIKEVTVNSFPSNLKKIDLRGNSFIKDLGDFLQRIKQINPDVTVCF